MSEHQGAHSDPGFIERVRRAVLEKFDDIAAFEEAMGWAPGFFENDVLGADMPIDSIADQVTRVLHCERDWLLTGEGEPYKRKAPKAPGLPEDLPESASPIVTTVRESRELKTRMAGLGIGDDDDDDGSGPRSPATTATRPTEFISSGQSTRPEQARKDDVDPFSMVVKSDGSNDTTSAPAGESSETPAASASTSGASTSGASASTSGVADDPFSMTISSDSSSAPPPPPPPPPPGGFRDDPFSVTIGRKADGDGAEVSGDAVLLPPPVRPGGPSRGASSTESVIIGAVETDGLADADRALNRAMQQQLSMMKDPPELDRHGLQFAVRFKPARGVASEFYDFLDFGENRIGIVLADVAGSVGLNVWGDVTMAIKTFRIFSRDCKTPREVLSKTNEDLVPDLMAESSLTVIFSILDLQTRKLSVAQSGHPPLLLYNQHRTPTIREIKPSGMVLGLVAGSKFDDLLEEETIDLQTGDHLLWYTEGVINTENPAGDQLGVDGVRLYMQGESGKRDPDDFLDYLFQQVDSWRDGGEPTGDCTALMLKVGMPPGLA